MLNTLHTEYLLELFNENLKNEQLKNTAVLSLIEPKDYLYVSNEEYFILKPIRPKILLSLIRGFNESRSCKLVAINTFDDTLVFNRF